MVRVGGKNGLEGDKSPGRSRIMILHAIVGIVGIADADV